MRLHTHLLLTSLLTPLNAQSPIPLHGSGTTNPSKCFWLIMSQIKDQAKIPLQITYRAVGSSTGQFEFMGVNNTSPFSYDPYNDFGSGDIPISTSNYNAMVNNGKDFVHLPFVMGSISLFHSVPGVGMGKDGLNLTSCLIAKIFKREIVFWDDDEIVALNDGLREKLSSSDFPINVARRVLGSSSTASVTEYLHTSCPEEWPIEMVGKEITWNPDTLPCEGSGGMSTCIRNNIGTIGYIDSGHGHDEGLNEIELENADGTFLSSKEAAQKGGIGAAADSVPPSADADFGDVKLLNKPGQWTWPIVAMSYVYVRKDLSFMPSLASQSLLKYFLRQLYEPSIIGQCDRFGFIPVPLNIREVALNGIDMVNVANETEAPEWTTEIKTIKGGGQGDYVISQKRRTFDEYAIGGNEDEIASLLGRIAELEGMVSVLSDTVAAGGGGNSGSTNEGNSATSNSEEQEQSTPVLKAGKSFTDDDETRLDTAFILSIVSIILSSFVTLFVVATKFCLGGEKEY